MKPVEKEFDFFKDLHATHAKTEATCGVENAKLNLKEGLEAGITAILSCHNYGRKLIFIGNGGSAAIASHQAVDYWKNGGIASIAFNVASLLTCIGNDFGYERVFAEPILNFAAAGDLLVAISSSGKSPNILNAVSAAQKMCCK